jgi:S1-C subfamily serine protease
MIPKAVKPRSRPLARCLLAVWLVLPAITAPAAPEPSPLAVAEQAAFQAAADRVAPSIVRIEPTGISKARLKQAAEVTPATGPSTGLVVAAEGWVLTSAFAVPADTGEAVIILPPASGGDSGGPLVRLVGRVVGRDTNRGLVLLKCDPPRPLPVPEWVDRSELAPGQWAIAAGRVWSATRPSLAVGVLSAVDRAWGRAVQTDAAISPANYGGPLLDIRGRVIGIIAPLPADTAGMNSGTELYDSGIGFAVPISDLLPLLPRLQAGEELSAGLLGIGYDATDAINGSPEIKTVRAESPAAAAGLQSGDRIVAIDGRSVERIADVRHALTPRLAGDAINLVVRRGKDKATEVAVTATLVDRLPPWRRTMLGLVPVRREFRARDRTASPEPAVVNWVWPESPAAKAGLKPGDTITAAAAATGAAEPEMRPVASTADLAGLLGGLAADSEVLLTIDRDDAERQFQVATMALPPEPPADVPTIAPVDEQPPATVLKLEAPELPEPAWAIVPAIEDGPPLGVLVSFDEPEGPLAAEAITSRVAAWRDAVTRYRVAVVFIGSADPARWSRADLDGVGRSLEVLRSRRRLDPTRIGFAGRGAGGTFAWLAADRFSPVVRGVALIDAALPRRATIEDAAPDRFRWVLFGSSSSTEPDPAAVRRQAADRERLSKAGITAGDLPALDSDAARAAALCRWVEALGVL